MARVGYVNPADAVAGDDLVVTSIWANNAEEAVAYARLLHEDNGWHTWARDDDLNVIWDSDPGSF